jgi:hypothetical protein
MQYQQPSCQVQVQDVGFQPMIVVVVLLLVKDKAQQGSIAKDMVNSSRITCIHLLHGPPNGQLEYYIITAGSKMFSKQHLRAQQRVPCNICHAAVRWDQ